MLRSRCVNARVGSGPRSTVNPLPFVLETKWLIHWSCHSLVAPQQVDGRMKAWGRREFDEHLVEHLVASVPTNGPAKVASSTCSLTARHGGRLYIHEGRMQCVSEC
jgi:hypothetical protein